MSEVYAPAPYPTYRLIPSRYPPIEVFATVATAADLESAIELAGWTDDGLVLSRLHRLPESEWVYGRPNASTVMAAFLHPALAGARFNGPDLGAWYASASLETAMVEVAHHLRREVIARQVREMHRQFCTYTSRLRGDYLDIRGCQAALPDVYASDDYTAGQSMGEKVRTDGGNGIIYDSVRLLGGVNIVAYHPQNVRDVIQAEYFQIRVSAEVKRIEIARVSTS